MSQFCRTLVAASAVLLAVTSRLPAQVSYDANADFVVNSPNPNGVWRYGYTTTLGGSFNLFSEYFTSSINYGWRTDISSGTPAFSYFTAPGFGALAGETTLHGGPNGEFAIVRFTAPITGAYDLLASWRGPGDQNNTDLYVLKNGNGSSPLASTPSTTTSGSFPLNNVFLNSGDTIVLVVGNGGDGFAFDNTPVNLHITGVPEPTSVVLLSIGSCLMLVRRRTSVCAKRFAEPTASLRFGLRI
jgi:hypothetical protein